MVYSRRIPLLVSVLIALVMVGGAFWLSSPQTPTANALSTAEALQAYAGKDADADGLPDWKEVLYETDPNNPHSVTPDKTDGEAVAAGLVEPRFKTAAEGDDMTALLEIYAESETVTDKFSKKFIENYLKKRVEGPLSKDELNAFIEEANAELTRRNITRYSIDDVKIGPRGQEAILKYVDDMDKVMVANSPKPDAKGVSEHFGDYVTGVETVRSMIRIREAGNAYTASAEAMMTVTVPPELLSQHLDFANAYALLGEVTTDMGAMDTDPVRGFLGFSQYEEAWGQASNTFAALGKAFTEQVDF